MLRKRYTMYLGCIHYSFSSRGVNLSLPIIISVILYATNEVFLIICRKKIV